MRENGSMAGAIDRTVTDRRNSRFKLISGLVPRRDFLAGDLLEGDSIIRISKEGAAIKTIDHHSDFKSGHVTKGKDASLDVSFHGLDGLFSGIQMSDFRFKEDIGNTAGVQTVQEDFLLIGGEGQVVHVGR